jgi:ribosome modulation factor
MEFPKIPRTGLGLRDIAAHAYRASTRINGENRELSPFEVLAQRPQSLHAIRQAMAGLPGGYSKKQMEEFDRERLEDPVFRDQTVRLGEYPDSIPKKDGIAAEAARRAAQGAGMLAADATSQGAQSLWWFINAFQAASSAAGQQAMHHSLRGIPGAPKTPFTRQHYAVSATFPLVLGASAAVGNLFRQPGYSAVLPDEEDRTESSNPLMEAGLRSLGMTGSLLPYKDFIQERPDVSRDEYESYKAYLHGNPMPVKVNMDGIHGAEVNLLGRPIPLLTGILPVAAGVAGGALGVRMAGKRLASSGRVNKFEAQQRMDDKIGQLRKQALEVDREIERLDRMSPTSEDSRLSGWATSVNQERERAEQKSKNLNRLISKTSQRKRQAQNQIEDALFLGGVGGSAAGLSITAAGASLMEQMRRAANAEENRQKQSEELTPVEAY